MTNREKVRIYAGLWRFRAVKDGVFLSCTIVLPFNFEDWRMAMINAEIKEVINETVNATVLKMQMAKLIKDGTKSASQKTEEVLRNYPTFKKIKDKPYTVKLVEKVEEALDEIRNDPYYDIIPMFYFEDETRESIALTLETTVRTVARNKRRLIDDLKVKLFSDDCIREILFCEEN